MTQYIIIDSYLEYLDDSNFLIEGVNINQSRLKQSYEKNKQAMISYLKDHGISINVVDSAAKKLKSTIMRYRNDYVDPKEASQLIYRDIRKSVNTILKSKKSNEESNIEKESSDTINKAILFFIIIAIIDIVLMLVIGPFAGAIVAKAISMIIVAPFLEEYFKRFAMDHPWLYTGMFSFLKFAVMLSLVFTGAISLPILVLMHMGMAAITFFTTWIQKVFYDKFDSEKMHWLGWLIAVIVHILLLVVGGAIMGHFIFDVGQSVPQITTGPSFNV